MALIPFVRVGAGAVLFFPFAGANTLLDSGLKAKNFATFLQN